jgi:transposase
VIKYVFLRGNSATKIYDDMSVTLGDKCPSYSTVKNWVARVRIGHLSTEDQERSGRPTQVTVPENLDAIHSMILDIGHIIDEISGMRKLSAK